MQDLKELGKLFALCRKHGVTDLTLDAMHIKFGELPAKKTVLEDDTEIETDDLTPEQLMFFSAGGA
jgi:hypothetical protein